MSSQDSTPVCSPVASRLTSSTMLPQGSTYYSPEGSPNGNSFDAVGDIELKELSLALREAEVVKREDAVTQLEQANLELEIELKTREAELLKREEEILQREENVARREFEAYDREDDILKAEERIKAREKEIARREQELKTIEYEPEPKNKQYRGHRVNEGILIQVNETEDSENVDPNVEERIDTIFEDEPIIRTPQRTYPRQSIGQWSTERIRNNMSVRSLVSSLEVQKAVPGGSLPKKNRF